MDGYDYEAKTKSDGDDVEVLPEQESKEEQEEEPGKRRRRRIPEPEVRPGKKGNFEKMMRLLIERGAYEERVKFYPRMKLRPPSPRPAWARPRVPFPGPDN